MTVRDEIARAPALFAVPRPPFSREPNLKMTTPVFHTLDEAFRYCRDMDASLRERLDTFSNAARALRPAMQEAVDRLVVRLMATDAGAGAPQIGDAMPNFVLPDEAASS